MTTKVAFKQNAKEASAKRQPKSYIYCIAFSNLIDYPPRELRQHWKGDIQKTSSLNFRITEQDKPRYCCFLLKKIYRRHLRCP